MWFTALPSDGLELYPGYLLWETYPSEEMQSAYSTKWGGQIWATFIKL